MWKAANVIGWLLTLIGLPSLPDDIEGWRSWLAMLAGVPWLTSESVRWVVFLVGLSILAWAYYPVVSSRIKGRRTHSLDFKHTGPGFERSIRTSGDDTASMRDVTGETIAQRGEVRIVSTGAAPVSPLTIQLQMYGVIRSLLRSPPK